MYVRASQMILTTVLTVTMRGNGGHSEISSEKSLFENQFVERIHINHATILQNAKPHCHFLFANVTHKAPPFS